MKRLAVIWFLLLAPIVWAADEWRVLSVNTNTGEMKPYSDVIFPTNLYIQGQIVLTNTVWDDILVPVYGLGRAGNNDPSESFTTGPNSDQFGVLFSPTTEQELFGKAQMSHRIKDGRAIHAHFHFTPTTTATGTVVLGVSWSWAVIGGTYPATQTASVTNVFEVNSQWTHKLAGTVVIPAPSGKLASSVFRFRIFRDATSASDNYPDAIDVTDFDIHHEQDKLGSDEEIP